MKNAAAHDEVKYVPGNVYVSVCEGQILADRILLSKLVWFSRGTFANEKPIFWLIFRMFSARLTKISSPLNVNKLTASASFHSFSGSLSVVKESHIVTLNVIATFVWFAFLTRVRWRVFTASITANGKHFSLSSKNVNTQAPVGKWSRQMLQHESGHKCQWLSEVVFKLIPD